MTPLPRSEDEMVSGEPQASVSPEQTPLRGSSGASGQEGRNEDHRDANGESKAPCSASFVVKADGVEHRVGCTLNEGHDGQHDARIVISGPREYVGFCIGTGQSSEWGPEDQVGYLLLREGDGWVQAGGHYSSSVGFAKGDIGRNYERRDDPQPSDTYRWAGQMTADEAQAAFPAAPANGRSSDA